MKPEEELSDSLLDFLAIELSKTYMIEAETRNRVEEIAEFVRGIDKVGIINIQKLLDRINERFPAIYRDAQEYYSLLNQDNDRYPNKRQRIEEIGEKYRGEDKTIRLRAMLLDRTIILLGDLASREQLTN